MSEPTTEPPPPADEPTAAPPTQAPPRRALLPWLTGAGFLILAAGLILVWRYPRMPPPSAAPTEALTQQLSGLEARVARLEQRPPPSAPDLGPLTARVTALEQRPAPSGSDRTSLEPRVAALEQRPAPNLAPLETRVAALEAAERAMQADLSRRLDAAESRLAASEKAARRIPLVQAAALALAAGRKLGDLPGAPAALARFADENPPTEASLRLAFPPAAREALAVAHPDTEGKPLLTRLWAEAQDLVTIRQGDRVLVGDPAAGVLEHARIALEAGDVAAAVAEEGTLQGAAAQAMAGWLAQARALLDARAALAGWAASG
jgi:hypothetical protein